MSDLLYTPLNEIEEIYSTLYRTFKSGTCRTIEWRREQLYKLAEMIQQNAEAFSDAIHKDIGKPRTEVYMMELGGLIERAITSAKHLDEWMKPEVPDVPDWQKAWAPMIHKTPKGPILVIAPWNLPVLLSLQPLIAAIAAGCPCVVKPSEITPASAKIIAELVPKYLDQSAFRVVNGAVQETRKLLDLRWAHIFYTGNGRVGRIVAAAAAKHLTPVSLELGGKSPVIVDSEYDLKLAAKRILWGKLLNAGQTCIAPDYVLVSKEKEAELVAAFKEQYATFFPHGHALQSPSYGRIVTPAHHARLKSLYNKTKGKTALGGHVDNKLGFEPTIVFDVKEDDALLEDEIFGPILPIVPVKSIAEAIDFVNARDHPLALYAFTNRPEVKQQLIDNTLSGSIVFNDTFQQVTVAELPFCGVGESGYGSQFLKYGFDAFTHSRSSIDMPSQAEPFLAVRYPPYTDEAFKALSAAAFMPIPKVSAAGQAKRAGN